MAATILAVFAMGLVALGVVWFGFVIANGIRRQYSRWKNGG